MNDILFLCQRIPYPPDKGDKIRSYRVLEHLQTKGHVHLGFLIDNKADWQHCCPFGANVQLPICRRFKPAMGERFGPPRH